MKVFISSTIRGLEAFRDAAATAARVLGHDVIRAEDFGASADSPQRVCLAGVRRADLVILLLGARYGDPEPPEGLSPTYEEYLEARDRGNVLVFVQEGVVREPRQEGFLLEVQEWSRGHFTASFSSAAELQNAVTAALHRFELGLQAGEVDHLQLVACARALMPDTRGFSSSRLTIALAGGPRQQVLRPGRLEADDLAKTVQREALFGPASVLDSESGTKRTVRNGELILEQDEASILLNAHGDVRIVEGMDGRRRSERYLLALIEEDVQAAIERAVRFGGWLLDHVDPKHRIGSVAIVASLTNAGFRGWMTRREQERSHGTVTMNMRGDQPVIVTLSPPVRLRAALVSSLNEIAEDLTVLLRRELKP